MKTSLITITFLSFFTHFFSQTVADVVQHSYTTHQGSARFEGLAGAMGAIGTDGSSVSINPAGMGRLSKNRFTASFLQNNITNNSVFQGINTRETASEFKPSSLNLVLASDVSMNNRGYLYHQFGFNYNRIDSYKSTIKYEGEMFNSLLDGFANEANGIPSSQLSSSLPFTSSLAWETYSMDENGQGGYIPRLTDGNMYHNRTVKTIGGMSEYSFSYSNNFLNKFYFGISYSLKKINFEQNISHQETLLKTAGVSLRSFVYNYNLETNGNGNTFKIGGIFLPVDNIRIGLSFHTKSMYKLTDTWTANMIANHDTGDIRVPDDLIPLGRTTYKLNTPAKLNLSLAYLFQTKGFINVDLEYLNYSNAVTKETLSNSDVSTANFYSSLTGDIQQTLRSTFNLKVGGEINISPNLTLRGGYAYYPTPYRSILNTISKDIQIISIGGGFKWGANSIDLAIRHQNYQFQHSAFRESIANIDQKRLGVTLSYTVIF